jgi:uncharacterized Tic20 family protein
VLRVWIYTHHDLLSFICYSLKTNKQQTNKQTTIIIVIIMIYSWCVVVVVVEVLVVVVTVAAGAVGMVGKEPTVMLIINILAVNMIFIIVLTNP